MRFPLKVKLTEGQKKALDSSPNVLISGPAGTGKTLLTILLCEKLLKEDPNLNIQIIIFTKSLKYFILKGLNERGLVNVTTDHLASWISDPEIFTNKVDISIIDEIQDFSISEIELIINNSTKGAYLLGDANQRIFNFEDRKLPKSFEEVSRKFNLNFIYLNEIVRFNTGIYNFIAEFEKTLSDASAQDVQIIKPQIIDCESIDSLFDKLIRIFNETGIDDTIGVICYRNENVKIIVDTLKARGYNKIGYKYYFNDIQIDHLDFINKRINILTIHSSKGIEFDHVVYIFVTFNDNIGKNPLNHYYVAFSRARKHLNILYYSNFTIQLNIKNNNTYLGQINRPFAYKSAKNHIDLLKEFINEIVNEFNNLGLPEKEYDNIVNEYKAETYASVLSILEKYTELSDEEIKDWFNKELNTK